MNKLFFNPLTFLVVLLVASFVAISLHQTAKRANTSGVQLQQLEGEIAALKGEIDQKILEASRAAEPFVKEKIARDQLLWQKPGEIVVELPPTTPTPEVKNVAPTQTPWQAWKHLLWSN